MIPDISRRQFFAGLGAIAYLPQIRVDVNLVNVFLTVQDTAGAFVSGLKAEDFRVFEDGTPQTISVFESANVPSAVGMLMDNSLSMVDILPNMKSGILEFARHKESFRELFVMTFGTTARVLHDFGLPPERLETSFKTLGVFGTSVLFDALIEGMRRLVPREPQRKALIVFTDGMDTASKAGFRDVLLEAQRTGVLLYFVPIGSRVLIDERTLDALARDTGGRTIYVARSQPIAPVIDDIRGDLDRQYYLGYYAARAPGFHAIRVELPGRNVRVRAKAGYLGA